MHEQCLMATIFLLVTLITTLPAMAWLRPEPGRGEEDVDDFADECDYCEKGPVVTCNEMFTIELLDFVREEGLVTFIYQVCKLGNQNVYTLDYWILGLSQLEDCMAEGYVLSDVVAGCSTDCLEEDDPCKFTELDPETQLEGIKFYAMTGDDQCRIFCLTLDETVLDPSFEIAIDCVMAATKAGEQDIRWEGSEAPGYACVLGPVCEEKFAELVCPKTQGFWKNHPDAWPVDSLMLGDEEYIMAELLHLLKRPVRGDASVILAKQLIAAKLNVASGSDPAPISDTIGSADDLLNGFSGKLPYRVRPSNSHGHEMVTLAQTLDKYNQAWLMPECERFPADSRGNGKGWGSDKGRGWWNGWGNNHGRLRSR